MALGLAAATGSVWITEHRTLSHQVDTMRIYYGLPALVENAVLTDQATEHSWAMARARTLFHSTEQQLLATPGEWEMVGENVGSASQIWLTIRAMMDGTTHREVLLGDWTEIGYGHVRADGLVYVTLLFRR